MTKTEYQRRAKLKKEVRSAKRHVKQLSMVDYRAPAMRPPSDGSELLSMVMMMHAMLVSRHATPSSGRMMT